MSKISKLEAKPDGKVEWADWMIKMKDSYLEESKNWTDEKPNPDASCLENFTWLQQHSGYYYKPYNEAHILLLWWHQEEAYDFIFNEVHKRQNTVLLSVCAQIHDERAIDVLLNIYQTEAQKILAKQATLWPLFVLKKVLSSQTTHILTKSRFVLTQLNKHPDWEEPLINSCDEQQKVQLASLIDVLIANIGVADVKTLLIKLANNKPSVILPKLLSLNPTRSQATGLFIQELLAANPEWAEQIKPACDEAQLSTLKRLLNTEQIEEATEEELPDILRLPPWRNQDSATNTPYLRLHEEKLAITFHCPEQMYQIDLQDCTAKVEEYFQTHCMSLCSSVDAATWQTYRQWPIIRKALYLLGAKVSEMDNICNSFVATFDRHSQAIDYAFFVLPKNLADAIFPNFAYHFFAKQFNYSPASMYRVIHWLDDTALMYAVQLMQKARLSIQVLKNFNVIEAPQLVMPMAMLALTNKWARPVAQEWIMRFAQTTAHCLIPHALWQTPELNSVAQKTLYWMKNQGLETLIQQAAEAYSIDAAKCINQILGNSPANILPSKLPTPPKNIPLQILPRLLLKSNGHAIPLACIPDVFMTFLLSKADEPYIGLTWLQEAIQPDSFAKFGQALFKWWMQHDAPAKERWIFDVQGLIGNDETARMLNSTLRQWRAALSRVRAYDAMNMLAQIGSDVALMYLDALAKQTRFNDLHERATRLITEVAEQRGLSAEQLADRTVPDLGLDERGMLMLDFGPRQFVLKFNESLQPRLEDSKGNVVKTLPKPNAKDHAELAKPASDLYKEVKKQAKAIASMQIKRLEAAMCSQRHWNVDEFMRFFVQHNLTRHLSQALVWGAFDEQNQLIATFRVAEDLTLTDANDDVYQPPDNAQIAIVHRLQLSTEQQQAFAQVLADYQKIQPFSQLAREIYSPVTEELSSNRLLAWNETRAVTSASLLGLEQRGWVRGVGEDAMVDHFSKSLDGLHTATLYVSPGWFVAGPPDNKEEHNIQLVYLDKQKTWNQVSAIVYSEVQRDLHLMAWFAA